MIWRLALYLSVVGSMGGNFAFAQTPADVESTTRDDGSGDLTGYWKNSSNQTVYFTQTGFNVIARFKRYKRKSDYFSKEVDFNATLRGDLLHGAHRQRLSRRKEKKCSKEIWVGMGLTLNTDHTKLTGFRGNQKINLSNCKTSADGTIPFVYTRMFDRNGKPLR